MMDSCGTCFINMPGEYALYKDLRDLHEEHDGGMLFRATPAYAGAPRVRGFDRCEANGGPGQSIATYLQKGEKDLARKLGATLTPSDASQAAVAAMGRGAGKGARNAQCLKIKEKRLSADLWRCNGQDYRGSHFPICAFTNNVGRRSPERLAARWRQWRSESEPQGHPYDTSRSRGDALAGKTPWQAPWEDASSSSWAGAGQADAAQSNAAQQGWHDCTDWCGRTQWGGWT